MSKPATSTVTTPADDAQHEPLPAQVIACAGKRVDEMLEAILRELKAAIPDYAQLDDPAMQVEEQARVTALTLLSLRAVLDYPFDETLIDAVGRNARRRAVRGFPLAAMLRSHDVQVRVVWDFVVEELFRPGVASPAEAFPLALAFSTKLLDASAQLRQDEASAYLEAERERAGTGEQARRKFLDELLNGEVDDAEEVGERALELGYQLARDNAVAVLSLDSPGPSRNGSPNGAEQQSVLRRLNNAVSFAIVGSGMPMVQTGPNSVVAVFGSWHEGGEAAIRSAIEKAVATKEIPEGCHLIAGLGRVEPGVKGIAVSYKQALRALEAARVIGVHGGVVSYADMLPNLLLLADPALTKDSWRATVEPLLAHDVANGTQLVETLTVFLEERGVLAATAKRLYVHRHTLTPRLEQIERLTGHSLQDHNDLFVLELGLRAQTMAHDTPTDDTD
jgi:sugar diacid utilization regulator